MDRDKDKETGEVSVEKTSTKLENYVGTDFNYKHKIVWSNVAIFVVLHLIGFYFVIHLLTGKISLFTILFNFVYLVYGMIGVTGGTHRLWTHRAYQANLPLRIILMIGQTSAVQNHIYEWSRDHRLHHKYTDTDADPHNSKRGFFFCHMGWLMCRKHPEVKAKGAGIDLSDLKADPVVRFQKKYYKPLVLIFNQLVPVLIPWYFFGDDLWPAYTASTFRYLVMLHGTWTVNSFAHLWGPKPYDKNINPTESPFVIWLRFGEGFHNYHHTFPWDYKVSEFGGYRLNWTTAAIDIAAKIGWATDLKSASEELIRKRALRTGDGSWTKENLPYVNNNINGKNNGNNKMLKEEMVNQELLWGWGDKAMTEMEKTFTDRRARA